MSTFIFSDLQLYSFLSNWSRHLLSSCFNLSFWFIIIIIILRFKLWTAHLWWRVFGDVITSLSVRRSSHTEKMKVRTAARALTLVHVNRPLTFRAVLMENAPVETGVSVPFIIQFRNITRKWVWTVVSWVQPLLGKFSGSEDQQRSKYTNI